MDGVGKTLLIAGAAVALIGALLILAPKIPFLGRLPGDIVLRRGDAVFAFPLATSIIVSVILTVVLNIAMRLFR